MVSFFICFSAQGSENHQRMDVDGDNGYIFLLHVFTRPTNKERESARARWSKIMHSLVVVVVPTWLFSRDYQQDDIAISYQTEV